MNRLEKEEIDVNFQNPFELIPSEITSYIFALLPSFAEYGRVNCVCKDFNSLMSVDETILESLCSAWWEQNNGKSESLALKWIRTVVEITNPECFTWKWFAQCFMKFSPLSWSRQYTYTWFLGEHKEDKLEGLGISVVNLKYSPKLQIGTFAKGNLEGDGFLVSTEGVYKGIFVKGQMDGLGIFKYSNGITYMGEMWQDQRDGDGVLLWPDGHSISSKFAEDFPIESNREVVVHPSLKELLDNGRCSLVLGKEQAGHFYECEECIDRFCPTCWKNCHKCKGTEESFIMIWWDTSFTCTCEKKDCKKPLDKCKKQKTE